MKENIHLLVDTRLQRFEKVEDLFSFLKSKKYDFEFIEKLTDDVIKQNNLQIFFTTTDNIKKHFLLFRNLWFFLFFEDGQESFVTDIPRAFELNWKDHQSVLDALETIYNLKKDDYNRYLKRSALSNLNYLLKESNRYLETIEHGLKDFKKILPDNVDRFMFYYKDLLQVEEQFIKSTDILDFIRALNDLVHRHGIVTKIHWDKNNTNGPSISNDKNVVILPLERSDQQFIYFYLAKENDDFTNFYLFYIYEMIQRAIEQTFKMNKMIQGNSFWEEAFLKIPLPIALMSLDGELILHNPLFAKLDILPKDCLKLADNVQVEIGDNIFHVIRKEIKSEIGNYHCFAFQAISGKDSFDASCVLSSKQSIIKNVPSSELGIISSSIAHELNNPLAGILSAITLLEYELREIPNISIPLDEMRKGAIRCKQLIDIFLGFSKFSPEKKSQGSLKMAFLQALDLLRFRMIESDVRLNIDVLETHETFNRSINISVVAMIFYLIFNEIVTAFSHLRLLNDVIEKIDNTVYGVLVESCEKIEINLRSRINYPPNVLASKLINYLVESEGLRLEVTDDKIILQNKNSE